MKQSICKILIITLLSYITTCIYALDTHDIEGHDMDARVYYTYNTVSAPIADMFRYGEFQTSLFTGRMQVSIPIYTVNDPDFKMDITLHYNAEGFKPRKHSGPVGYNWFLEAGGCITREVNGYPDEIIGQEVINTGTNYGVGVEGMFHFITQSPNSNNMDTSDIFELPLAPISQACTTAYNLWHNVGGACDYKVDYTPDIFHFDFLGYRGSFMIDNSGRVRIISGDYVEVDLSGILTNWDEITPPTPAYPKENSVITIKTTDGYTYIFGGDLSCLEYTVSTYNYYYFLPPASMGSQQTNPAIVTTWHLSKVIAPNKRTVTYYYKHASNPYSYISEDIPDQNSPLWVFNENYDRFGKYYKNMAVLHDQIVTNNMSSVFNDPYTLEEYNCLCRFYTPPYTYTRNIYYTYSATKTCILDSIHISGEQPLRIIFNNAQETKAMYNYPNRYNYNIKHNYQLNTICVLSADRVIKTANLSYIYKSYQGNSYSFNWRFLNTVHISGVGTYQMNYNDGYFPDLYNSSCYPHDYDHIKGESFETDDYGYYVSANCSIALLQKLTYPTGGYQTYTYQPYNYTKKRKYSVVADSNIEMQTINESGTKKGARIHEVKTYDGNNHLIETKLYTYSNGIYFDNLKVYNLAENLYPQYGWPVRYNATYGLLNTHIGYGQVVEHVTNTDGTYKIVYQFDTGEDSYASQNDTDLNGRYGCNNRKFGIMEGHLLYASRLKKWGKMISIKNYDSNNILVKSAQFEYNDISGKCQDTIVIFDCGYEVEISKKLYLSPDVLIKKITIDYSQGDSLETTNSYSYDLKLRVKRETVEDSQGILRFTKYTYPDEVKLSANLFNEPPLRRLVKANRISTPVETVAGYIQGDKEYVISGNINLYATGAYGVIVSNNTNSPAHISPFPYPGGDSIFTDTVPMWPHDPYIDLVYYPYLHKSMSLTLLTPLTDYQPMAADGDDITYDSRYRLSCEYNFDWMYRPVSIKPFGKTATTYTWNGIYPATKTVGNQTWTYTYKPHVGLETMTDPRSITTYYTYDSAGRLIEEYQLVNGKKQILHVYQYHIKTE